MHTGRPGTEIRVADPTAAARRSATRMGRPEPTCGAGDPTLAQAAWTVLEYRWTVLLVVALSLGLGAAWLFVATPSYESSVLVQVEAHTKTVPGFADVSPLFDRESNAEAEMRILRARPVLESVVDELRLDTAVRPRTLPLVGEAVARRRPGPGLAPPPVGLVKYAWGGERISIPNLDVSPDLLGQPLTLTALQGGGFQVSTPERGVLVAGTAGQSAASAPGGGHVELLVSELVARPGTEFVVTKRLRDDVVEELQSELRVSEQGKATGVVEIALSGRDPGRIAAVLNAIARVYIRQNRERTSAEATKTLQFLQSQLPALKANMDRAEEALNSLRRARGPVDLSLEGKALVDQGTDMDKRLSQMEVESAELHQRYSDEHPAVLAAEERLRNLRAQRDVVDNRMRALPGLELDAARLARSARLASELYLNVQNRSQELRIVNAGWIGSVRILEPAVRPTRTASPRGGAILALGLLLGLAGGVGVAFARKGLREGVEDPDDIEAVTGLPVLGTISRSRAQRRLERRRRRGRLQPLSLAAPRDPAVEDLRSLRTSVLFALQGARNNVVTVSGPAPKVGKSLVSANLAHLLAAAGRHVLLVDADFRRGELQRLFGVPRQPGLSDLLLGAAPLDEAIRGTDVPGLSFLPTGQLPQSPAELTTSPGLEPVLAALSARFDVVIVDTPPILAVTEAALVARHAGVNLLVVRAGGQSVQEIAFTLRRLSRNGVALSGVILNDVRPAHGRYGRFGGYRLYSADYAAQS